MSSDDTFNPYESDPQLQAVIDQRVAHGIAEGIKQAQQAEIVEQYKALEAEHKADAGFQKNMEEAAQIILDARRDGKRPPTLEQAYKEVAAANQKPLEARKGPGGRPQHRGLGSIWQHNLSTGRSTPGGKKR